MLLNNLKYTENKTSTNETIMPKNRGKRLFSGNHVCGSLVLTVEKQKK